MKNKGKALMLGILVIIFLVLIAFPLILVTFSGLGGEEGLSLSLFSKIFGSSYYRGVIFFTFEQAAASVILTLLLGLPGAYIFSNYEFRGKGHLLAISTVPFVLPSVLVVLGFVIFFGSSGVLNSLLMDIFGLEEAPLKILYSWRAIVLAHSFYNIPLVLRFVSSVWKQVDERMLEAAQNVGASRFRIFRDIEFPYISQSILSVALLTFIYSFTSFAIVLALGGPTFTTMEVTIYSLASFYGTYGLSSSLAIIQLFFLLLVVWAYTRIRVLKRGQGQKTMRRLSSLGTLPKIGVGLYAVFIGIFLMGPMAAIVRSSFMVREFGKVFYSLKWFREIFSTDFQSFIGTSPLGSIAISLFIALVAMLVSVTVGLMIAYYAAGNNSSQGLVSIAVMVPLCVSTITLALGYVILDSTISMDISLLAIVAIHSIISFPFSFRAISNSLARMDCTLVEAASGLGASRIRSFFTIDLPLIRGGILAASVFSFAISLGELAAAYLLYGGRYTTIPIYIYRYIGGYRFGSAAAMGVILMAVSAASFFMIERLGSKIQF